MGPKCSPVLPFARTERCFCDDIGVVVVACGLLLRIQRHEPGIVLKYEARIESREFFHPDRVALGRPGLEPGDCGPNQAGRHQ